jgi:hypothetical protein
MLEQLFDLVKGLGKETVVENPEVPNEYNNDVMAEATNTVASGFRNIMAGGGLESIINLFRGGGGGGQSQAGGIGNLMKNPIVSMMVGYFISKLVKKYNMSSPSASNVATNLIPNVINSLIEKTRDPNNSNFTLDGLIKSFTGGGGAEEYQPQNNGGGGFNFQDLISKFTGGGNGNGGTGGINIQDIINKVTERTRSNIGNQEQTAGGGGGGLFDLIKGFIK